MIEKKSDFSVSPEKSAASESEFRQKLAELEEKIAQDPESVQEVDREFLSLIYESLMIEFSRKINEGKNAFILALEENPDLRKDFQKSFEVFLDREDSQLAAVVKLIKIFKSRQAAAEATNQIKAAEIVNNGPEKESVRVPEIFNRKVNELKLSNPEKFRDRLRLNFFGEEINFIIMERIAGTDLYTLAVREALKDIIKRDPEEGYGTPREVKINLINKIISFKIAQDYYYPAFLSDEERARVIKTATFIRNLSRGPLTDLLEHWNSLALEEQELFSQVYNLEEEFRALRGIKADENFSLDDYLAGLNSQEILENLVENYRGDFDSATFLRNSLKGKNLVEPRLLDDLRKVIFRLHKNGFYHRDLHERNIMVTDDGRRLYLIDFDKANPEGSPNSSDQWENYRSGGENFGVTDEGIVSKDGLLAAACRPSD